MTGFPSSSHQFIGLAAILGTKYRVLAPDFPGFGFTQVPAEAKYEYTTSRELQTIEAFLDALDVKSFTIYLHDYGAPLGLRCG